jgi:ribonuclease J
MNATLYGARGKWLLADAGCAFPDENLHPEIERVMLHPGLLLGLGTDLVGLVVTHAHEDHVGAIPFLWPPLKAPIHATPFAARLIRDRLAERGTEGRVELIEHSTSDRLRIGPFDVRIIPAAHSIPEATMLAIRSEEGLILHTGDWKLDAEPLVGERTELAELTQLSAAEGFALVVCDSTNAAVPGKTPSEAIVETAMGVLLDGWPGAAVVACFSSNVARIKAIALAAEANGRKTCLCGRSLVRIERCAREAGFLNGVPEFIDVAEAAALPRKAKLILCAGTQGEKNSAMTKIIEGTHPRFRIMPDDLAVWSARRIPGNEERVEETQRRAKSIGAKVITPDDGPIHVSGHPARDDVAKLLIAAAPKSVLPTHGGREQIAAMASLAEALGMRVPVIARDGDALRLDADGPTKIASVGRTLLGLSEKKLIPFDDDPWRRAITARPRAT